MGCSCSTHSHDRHKVVPVGPGESEDKEKESDSARSQVGPLKNNSNPNNLSHQQLRSIDPSSAEVDGGLAHNNKDTPSADGDEKIYWDSLGSFLLRGSGKTVAMSSLVGRQFSGNMVRMHSKKKAKHH